MVVPRVKVNANATNISEGCTYTGFSPGFLGGGGRFVFGFLLQLSLSGFALGILRLGVLVNSLRLPRPAIQSKFALAASVSLVDIS